MEGLAARIRDARRRRGWTQERLAAAIGVTRSAVAQWETGRSGQITANLARISDVLETSIEDLVGSRAGMHLAATAPRQDGGGDCEHVRTPENGAHLGDELALLRLYRTCSPDDQRLLLLAARRLSQKSDDA